jgi:hypothetical protein
MLMAVMLPRERWTDERLDELNKKVDDGFARVDKDIRELRGEVKDLRSEMNARFDAQSRNLIVAVVTIVAALIGVNAF